MTTQITYPSPAQFINGQQSSSAASVAVVADERLVLLDGGAFDAAIATGLASAVAEERWGCEPTQ